MKKILCLLLLVFITISCGPTRRVVITDIGEEQTVLGAAQMKFTMNRVLGISQLDSMIVVDKLSKLEDWIYVPIGNTTANKVNQYMYIKSLGETELIYTATQINRDTLYKCTKRITEKISD